MLPVSSWVKRTLKLYIEMVYSTSDITSVYTALSPKDNHGLMKLMQRKDAPNAKGSFATRSLCTPEMSYPMVKSLWQFVKCGLCHLHCDKQSNQNKHHSCCWFYLLLLQNLCDKSDRNNCKVPKQECRYFLQVIQTSRSCTNSVIRL